MGKNYLFVDYLLCMHTQAPMLLVTSKNAEN